MLLHVLIFERLLMEYAEVYSALIETNVIGWQNGYSLNSLTRGGISTSQVTVNSKGTGRRIFYVAFQ
jgi:hypothetical protein